MSKEDTAKNSDIPLFVKPWVKMYNAVPHIISYPFTKVSMTFSIVCAIYLLIWRLVLIRVLISYGWPGEEESTWIAVESLPSIIHSMTLCPMLYILLRTQPYNPVATMHSHPQWWQDGANAMIEFCTGYMLYDALSSLIYRNYVFTPGAFSINLGGDLPFLGHHILTASYMASCRIRKTGHISAMMMMFQGELTNPLQNFLLCVDEAVKLGDCCLAPWASYLYPKISFVFNLLYISIRAIIGPICIMHMTYVFLFTKEGKKNVPLSIAILWLFILWAIILGSIPWMFESLDILKSVLFDGDGNFQFNLEDQEL